MIGLEPAGHAAPMSIALLDQRSAAPPGAGARREEAQAMEQAGSSATLSTILRSTQIFRDAFGNCDLRRVLIAFVGFTMALSGTWIAMLVVAYRVGGAAPVAVVGAAQLIPAAAFAPFVATLGDVQRRERILMAGYLGQAVTTTATGIAILEGAPLPVIVALAGAFNVTTTLTRPVQGALLPALSRTPQELLAANVIAGWS